MRRAREDFLGEFAATRRGSRHTLSAYRRDIERVLDMAAGGGGQVAPALWTRELLERATRELHRLGHASTSSARALAAWRSFPEGN